MIFETYKARNAALHFTRVSIFIIISCSSSNKKKMEFRSVLPVHKGPFMYH